ncbi:DUF169 domain-containing protein [Candidatus Bathyarchaeota archaeon]|nr:DUF169 domain-containing protein [Candidatus Bathyarchaeota archaeon]
MNLRKVLKETEESLRSYLGLRGHLVGVKLDKTREISEDAFKPEMPMAFCQMIREASLKGDKFLYGLEHEKCPTAQLVLGLKDFKYLRADSKIVPSGTKKILISPLSDIPAGVTEEFEKIGFSKGTDYFFGKFNGRNVRVYLNRDANGRINLITIHFPIKMSSQEEAEELAKRLSVLLSRPYYVNVRGRWLDLTVRSSMDALGIDLFDSSSLKIAIERFVNKIGLYLNKVKI